MITVEEFKNSGMNVVNYHKHTTWSNFFQIDSTTTIEEFLRRSDELGQHVYYSGEHGYPGEWLYCWNLCEQTKDEKFREKIGISAPVKFRYSAEVYWVKDPDVELKDKANCHMVLIARNYRGVRQLNYLISEANENGYYYKPRVGLYQILSLNPDDVYVTSACLAGWKYTDADDIWLEIAKHFGDSFFFEYQCHNTEPQRAINRRIHGLATKYGINTVVGLDTHYISDEDRIKRDNLLLRNNIHYDDEDDWYMDYPDGQTIYNRLMEQGVLSEDEIIRSMMNTFVIDDGCEDITYDTGFKIPVMDKYKDLSYDERADVLLKLLKFQYNKEDDDHRTKDRYDGMMYEFGEIRDSGTVDYFLDNYAIVHNAVKNHGGQLTTTSRGSASSYYCSKLCGFTTVDRFNTEVPMYPERFITKERILSSKQMPDIDMNVVAQEPFRDSAREIFGKHSCYPLLAVGKLKEKSAFKMYAGVKGIEPSTANEITQIIDKYNEDRKNADDDDRDNIKIEDYITDPKYYKIYKESIPYQSIIQQARVHACGFALFNGNPRCRDVEGYGDLRYEIGLIRCHSETTGKSTIVLNIEGGLLDALGFVKDDFLIVDVVGLIYEFYHAIGREVPTFEELKTMVSGDKPTWDIYANGATCCINQVEKAGSRAKTMKYKPQNIAELSMLVAAIRPGFASLVNNFIERRPYSTGQPEIDEVLSDTNHYMVFQESVMKVLSYLGMPMSETYGVIKSISKKKLKGEKKEALLDKLRKSWKNKFGNLDNFQKIWQIISDSSRYAFNSAHAYSMAGDSLYSAYIKAHYPSVFYEVAMNHYQNKGNKVKVAELRNEAAEYYGYKMGSYHFGVDSAKVTIDDETKTIYPSLVSIKGIGSAVGQCLNEIYSKYPETLSEIYFEAKDGGVTRPVMMSLAKIGYFSDYGPEKYVVQCFDLCEKFKDRKTVNVDELFNPRLINSKYLYRKSPNAKRLTIVDRNKFLDQMMEYIPKHEYGVAEKVSAQVKILGYSDIIDEKLDWRYCCVLSVDTKYSPKLVLYSIHNGNTQVMKVHKSKGRGTRFAMTCWKDLPLEIGDIINIKSCEKTERRKNIDGRWVPSGEFEWWIGDYYLVYRDDR